MGSQDQLPQELNSEDMKVVLSFPDLIAKKRDGHELSADDIQHFVSSVTDSSMEDSQIGSMLMAIFLRGMNLRETSDLTCAMMRSGMMFDWPEDWLVVDKHSTGGVGDKISLPLAPALAACGLKNPMISGRGLGHTGGTLDKLESIPGYQVVQTLSKTKEIVDKVGCCIVGQNGTLVPADKILYATRDVTATVPCKPLFVSSILSKKGAEGLKTLVLDVKFGRGAGMKNEKDARQLSKQMVDVCNALGVKLTALGTDMDRPIGRMIGNALEVVESMETLRGKGPKDTRELVELCGGYCLYNVGKAKSPEEGARAIGRSLDDGSALEKWREMIKAQGVSDDIADRLCDDEDNPFAVLAQAKYKTPIPVLESGYMADLDALPCGEVTVSLGAGRAKSSEPVDHAVGLELHYRPGDFMEKGTNWVTIHHNKRLPSDAIGRLQQAMKTSSSAPTHLDTPLLKFVIE